MPSELTFRSELNTAWSEENDGNLYCVNFAGEGIKPGETKTAKLVLTRNMDGDATGQVENTAEIYEASNTLGTDDKDSTPANGVKGEDDISTATVIFTIKTGATVTYMLTILTAITIIGLGIYFIDKKVLR